MFKGVKEWIRRLGEENERLYGRRGPDCCGPKSTNRTVRHQTITRQIRETSNQKTK